MILPIWFLAGFLAVLAAPERSSYIWRLNSIEDLHNADLPQLAIQLLFWFSHNITFLDENRIRWCDPRTRAFGLHEYENRELLLPQGPSCSQSSRQYYSLGNLNHRSHSRACELPEKIRAPFLQAKNPRERKKVNRGRLILAVELSYTDTADAGLQLTTFYCNCPIGDVYISDHYDEQRTFYVGRNLLRALRDLPLDGNCELTTETQDEIRNLPKDELRKRDVSNIDIRTKRADSDLIADSCPNPICLSDCPYIAVSLGACEYDLRPWYYRCVRGFWVEVATVLGIYTHDFCLRLERVYSDS